MLSIIIPTLNEEKYLPRLLSSLKRQQGIENVSYEVIVADAGSTDRTRAVASQYGCQIVRGGLPARGRNQGAGAAQGSLCLFLDADVELPEDFLRNTLNEFYRRKLASASFSLKPKRWSARLLFDIFYNIPAVFMEHILPHGSMGILVRRTSFDAVGGFDETVKLAEDHWFVRQTARIGRFGIIRSTCLIVSLRRFWTDGWLRTAFTYLLCELHMIFIGPVRTDLFRYKFNHYKK